MRFESSSATARKFSFSVFLSEVWHKAKPSVNFRLSAMSCGKLSNVFQQRFFLRVLQNFTTKKRRVALFIVAFFVFLIIAFLGFEMTCILLKSAYCFDNFFPHVDVASVRTHRGYGNVAVNGGVGVQRVVVPVFMHAVAVL